ncbi:hypothetical protein ACMYSQ_005123 [Aspergillus niger]
MNLLDNQKKPKKNSVGLDIEKLLQIIHGGLFFIRKTQFLFNESLYIMLAFLLKSDHEVFIDLTIWIQTASKANSWPILPHLCSSFESVKETNEKILVLISTFIKSVNKNGGFASGGTFKDKPFEDALQLILMPFQFLIPFPLGDPSIAA